MRKLFLTLFTCLFIAIQPFSAGISKAESGVLTGIKSSFTGGEFAPSLYSRVDLAKYATGAKTLRNFIIHPHGGISNRPGLEYIATEKTTAKKIRLIPFEFSATQTYVLEFGEKYARVYSNGARVGGAMVAADSYLKFLTHLNGVDGATTDITAETGQTISLEGNAQLDTAQKAFGTASLLFDGTGDYASVPDSDNWSFGAGDFTVDFWIRFAANTVFYISQSVDADNRWYINYDGAGVWNMIFASGGVTKGSYTLNGFTPALNTWYHMAFVRSGTTGKIFKNGVSQTLTENTAFGTNNVGNIAAVLYIGAYEGGSATFNGWIDEPRISKGIARWTSDFSVPITEYDLVGDAAAWITSTGYVVGDFASESSIVYICLVAHTSGTFADDLAAGYWAVQPIYEIATPYTSDDLADIQYTQSADVLYLTHPDYAPRQLERHSELDWVLNLYDYQNGPFQLANADSTDTVAISAVTGTGLTLTAAGFTFNSLQIGSLWKLTHYIEGQAVSAALDAAAEVSTSIKCGGTWRFITHGTWTGTIQIEKSTTNAFAGEETMLREFSSADDFNANTYGTEDMSDNAEPFYIRIIMTARTSGICNINLSSDPFYQDGIVKITAVAVGGVTATATVIRTCGAITATADWAEGSWSPYRGYPAVVEFHPEDRLMFANTYTEPQTYWMTKTGDYTNFATSDPLADDDAISSPLPSRKINGINGLVALNEMIALTLSNEVSVKSSSGPISPTTAYNKVHGWEGSYGVKPIVIGSRAIYVQSTGSIIRDLGYAWASDSFDGADLTIFSNHLFSGHTIVDMAYQQNPDRLVWAIRDDGKLLSMTYMREQEVVAWSWHDTNDGTDLFESVCCIKNGNYDEVWFSVNRGGTRYIERMKQRMTSTVLHDQFFVDCGTTFDSTATTTFTVSQLASKAVSVLADGVEVTGKTVSAGGVLTLDTAASVVQVGLAYKSDMETLNVEVGLADGTAQGRKVKISRVVLRVLNAAGGYLGLDSSNLFAITYDNLEGYTAGSLFSGDIKETAGVFYTEGGRLFFRQTSPLPVTITGVIPEVTVAGMTST